MPIYRIFRKNILDANHLKRMRLLSSWSTETRTGLAYQQNAFYFHISKWLFYQGIVRQKQVCGKYGSIRSLENH